MWKEGITEAIASFSRQQNFITAKGAGAVCNMQIYVVDMHVVVSSVVGNTFPYSRSGIVSNFNWTHKSVYFMVECIQNVLH